MKKYILVFLISMLFSCKQNSNSENIITVEKRKIDPFLEEIFINKYPNYLDNDIVKEKSIKLLTNKVDSLLPYGVLKDIPLKVMSIGKNPHGKGALVQFYVDNESFKSDKKHKGLMSNFVQFDVIALMPLDYAEKLIKDECYYIDGKANRINQTQLDLLVDLSYYGAIPSIEKSFNDNSTEYKLGAFVLELNSFKHYPTQFY